MVVYIAEDHEIPWFQAALISELASAGGGGFGGRGAEATRGRDPQQRPGPGGGGGSVNAFLEPKDKLGVAALTASIIRAGGTPSMNGDQINERMDFLAGTVTATNLSIHMRHVDEGLKIWTDLLKNPAFPDDKLRREKDSILLGIRNRNRNVTAVATRTFNRLDVRGRVAGGRRGDRGDHDRHQPRRPGRLAQEVLGRQQLHPRGGRRLQEGGDASEARGDLWQVAPRRARRCRSTRGWTSRPRPASTWCSRRGPRRTRASSAWATSVSLRTTRTTRRWTS